MKPRETKAREWHIGQPDPSGQSFPAWLVTKHTSTGCLIVGCVLAREVLPRRKPAAKKGKR